MKKESSSICRLPNTFLVTVLNFRAYKVSKNPFAPLYMVTLLWLFSIGGVLGILIDPILIISSVTFLQGFLSILVSPGAQGRSSLWQATGPAHYILSPHPPCPVKWDPEVFMVKRCPTSTRQLASLVDDTTFHLQVWVLENLSWRADWTLRARGCALAQGVGQPWDQGDSEKLNQPFTSGVKPTCKLHFCVYGK